MKPPRPSKVRRQALTDDQARQAVSILAGQSPRTRAALLCPLLTGARISDVVALHVEDLDLTPGAARIRFRDRKAGGSDEWLPLAEEYAVVVGAHLRRARIRSGPVFPARLVAGATATTESIGVAWRRLGLPGSPHQARHFFATKLLADGATIEEVRTMLGHADVGTTQIYLHADPASLRRGVRRLGQSVMPGPDSRAPAPDDLPEAPTLPVVADVVPEVDAETALPPAAATAQHDLSEESGLDTLAAWIAEDGYEHLQFQACGYQLKRSVLSWLERTVADGQGERVEQVYVQPSRVDPTFGVVSISRWGRNHLGVTRSEVLELYRQSGGSEAPPPTWDTAPDDLPAAEPTRWDEERRWSAPRLRVLAGGL